MKWITRQLESTVLRLSRQRPGVVITGARQTGKTSLARRLFPDHAFVSLDLPSEAEQAERDPSTFLRRHPPPLVVDEVQYAPGLFRHLKMVIDTQREKNGQFILTGSQKPALMQGVSESLAGRVGMVELEGCSWEELRLAGVEATTEAAVVRGGMPELWEKQDLHASEFHRAYTTTYLERDLRTLLDVGSLRDFERFLRACALRSAQVLNKADLARDIGISPSTVSAWISVLEASNQICLLEPWFSNRTKSLVKSPKLYLCDSGLLCYLLGIDTVEELTESPYRGAVWETFVCAELRKKLRLGGRGELFFWRDRTKEVDFLVHKAGKFELLDAKWSEHPNAKEAHVLASVAATLPEHSIKRMALICRTPNAYPLPPQGDFAIHAVPVWEA